MTDPIKGFLDEAASISLDEAQEDLRQAKQEVAQLSFTVRAVSSECTELRKELTRAIDECRSTASERDVREKEKGELQKMVEDLRKKLDAKGAELQKVVCERDARAKEKGEAQEEAKLTLLQLHQVQEDLEHQFFESRAQHDLLRQHQRQSLAMRKAISKLVALHS